MIAQTVTYENFNDEKVTRTFHFHITKSRLTENLDLQDEIEKVALIFDGDDLTRDEVQQVLSVVKRLMKMSYGVRSEDGERFVQDDETWNAFKDSAGYDAVLFDMFENPDKAFAFMSGIMPKDLAEEARKAAQNRPELRDHLRKATSRPVEDVKSEVLSDPAEDRPVPLTIDPTYPAEDELEAFRRWQESQASTTD